MLKRSVSIAAVIIIASITCITVSFLGSTQQKEAGQAVLTKVTDVSLSIPRIVSSNTRGRLPLTVFFDASFSDVSHMKSPRYVWEFGDGTRAEGIRVSHRYDIPGIHSVVLRIEDTTHHITKRHTVLIGTTHGEPPNATIDAQPLSHHVPYSNRGFLFDGRSSIDLDGNVISYQWHLGDGTYATSPTLIHTYHSPGVYHVFLLVTDDVGNTATTSLAVRVS